MSPPGLLHSYPRTSCYLSAVGLLEAVVITMQIMRVW